MAGTRTAFSSGTAAAEKPKPNYRPFVDDVRRGNLANLPDRLRDVTERLHAAARERGASDKISDALAAFALTGNAFVMNTASRLAEAAEAGVFSHKDAPAVIRKLMAECPAAADSVPKMLSDLRKDLGAGFYALGAGEMASILRTSLRRSSSHCPNEIHRKMTELTIRGEFDHIPQMRELRAERQPVREVEHIIIHADAAPVPAGCPAEAGPARFAQEYGVSVITAPAERIMLAELVMPQRQAEIPQPVSLRSMPLVEAGVMREARQPKTPALQPKEQMARAEHRHAAPETVAKAAWQERMAEAKGIPATAEARPVAPEKAVKARAAGEMPGLERVRESAPPRQAPAAAGQVRIRVRPLVLPAEAPVAVKKAAKRMAAVQWKPAAKMPERTVLKRAAERVRRVCELARTAWNSRTGMAAKKGKRGGAKPAAPAEAGRRKESRGPLIPRTGQEARGKKAGGVKRPGPAAQEKGKPKRAEEKKNRVSGTRQPDSGRRGPARFRRTARSASRPRRRRSILRFLIDPKFFSLRRQRKAVRA